MPLLQSVLTRLSQTKKPQQKFLTHLLGLMLMLPGHATFRNLSRYRPSWRNGEILGGSAFSASSQDGSLSSGFAHNVLMRLCLLR
jgi:hypothetical protein